MCSVLDLKPVGESTIKPKTIELLNVVNLFMHGLHGKCDMIDMTEKFVPLALTSTLFSRKLNPLT